MVTTKERLKAKKTHVLLSVLVICVFLIIVVQLLCRGREEEDPIQVYADEDLKCRVANFQEPGVFDNFNLGWNNETFWFKNVGDQRVEIGLCVTALPKGWAMIWDYDRLPIEPDSAVKVVISVFSAYLMPTDSLMLGVDFKYCVLDQE